MAFPDAEIKVQRKESEITISGNRYLRFVHFSGEGAEEIRPEDNYFDVLPGMERKIRIKGYVPDKYPEIEVKALNSTTGVKILY